MMFDKLQQIGIEIYNKGLTEGKKGAYSLENMKKQSEYSYQRGLDEAWRAARWIMDLTSDDVKRHDVIGDCAPKFALTKYSASQAIELIRKYEEKQNRYEVPSCKTCIHNKKDGCAAYNCTDSFSESGGA